jgi:hypothetical protein
MLMLVIVLWCDASMGKSPAHRFQLPLETLIDDVISFFFFFVGGVLDSLSR